VKRSPLRRYTPLRARAVGKRRPPAETRYRAWIRSLSCVVCDGAHGPSEAAHTNALGCRGLGQKSDNRSCIPLCSHCHTGARDSYHQLTPESRWADTHGLDLHQLVRNLNASWDLSRRRAA
jgi:hypothetical protein